MTVALQNSFSAQFVCWWTIKAMTWALHWHKYNAIVWDCKLLGQLNSNLTMLNWWWWIRVPKSVRRYDSGTTGRGVTSILKIWEITYNNVLQRWCFFKKLTFLYSWWSKDNVRKTIYMMTIRMMIKMIFRMIFRMMKNDTNKDSVYWNFYLTSQWSYVKAWLTA